MEFGFWEILQILGSLAFFIFGMKMMSDGVQRAAGSEMRRILRSMTKNRYLGVLTGFLITALLQSSSATTVMTVSFVNAGLLSLVESAGVMMGANVGTTITGWIISWGFKINLAAYSIPLLAVAVPMYFSHRGKLKYWGEFLIGFSILFMALSFLKQAVPDPTANPEALEWMTSLANWGLLSRVLFVFIGAIITIIIQSSSAAMLVTLSMVAQGWLPLDIAAAMVLGENIGTTITAELAAVVGNTSARRSARIHSMFNIIGIVWMVILLPVILPLLQNFMDTYFNTTDATMTLAAFHTFFNLANVILLLGFVPFLVKAAKWSVPNKEEDTEEGFGLKFIIGPAIRTPELATVEVQKELGHFGEVVSKMSKFARALINATETKKRTVLLKKLKKYEEISDEMEFEITEYVTKLADQKITPKTSKRLRSALNVCNDLERIADIYFQISKTIEMKNEEKIYFLPHQRENLNLLSDKLDAAFKEMERNLKMTTYSDISKTKALELEKEINVFRNKLRDEHLKRLGDYDYNVKSAMVYNNIFHALEKVGDHIVNVTEAIVGEI